MPATQTAKKLSPLRLDAAKPADKAYKISDSDVSGLFCLIQPGGTKTFILSYSHASKRKEVKLGRYPGMTLSQARADATAARVAVEKGDDPAALKKAQKQAQKAKADAPNNTFAAFAAKWGRDKLIGRSATYKKQIQSRLDRFVFPVIGAKALEEVKPIDVLKIIQPLQTKMPNTAEGTRGIIQAVFNYAVQTLLVEANPATPLRGVVTVPQRENARHLSPKEFTAFWKSLNAVEHIGASTLAAAKLLVYTMARKSEVTHARWSEIDLDRSIMTIPAERMKAKLPHRIFLSKQAKEVLEAQRKATGQLEYVFPSVFKANQPLGAATLNHFFKRLDFGVPEFSPHGTRGTAATYLRENGIRRDVVELLLAHTEKGVAAHYHHHELVQERTEALQFWADEIDSLMETDRSADH